MIWITTHIAVVVGIALAVPAIAHLLSQRRLPQSTVAWLLIIVLMPWVGVPMYVAFGGRKMAVILARKSPVALTGPAQPVEQTSDLGHLLSTLNIPGPLTGHTFTLNRDGNSGLRSLLEVIESAEHSIEYATFIFGRDDVGREVMNRLVERASSGVKVRLLLDGVGCAKVSHRFLAPLRRAGGEVAFFMPLLHNPFRGRSNLRNHRKMTIADGCRVWAGGCNTADEYIGPDLDASQWRDLSFSLSGPSVDSFSEIFAADWEFATGSSVPITRADSTGTSGDQSVQVIPSGPDVAGDPLLGALLTSIYQARNRIWVVTPYFVAPEAGLQALCLAAQRGVEVRIVLPAVSNHRMADWARGPQLRELHKAGASILMCDTMVHAKVTIIDSDLAFIGSANFDSRSLLLNYEVMLLLHGGDGVVAIQQWAESLSNESAANVPQAGRVRNMFESLAGIAAPLL